MQGHIASFSSPIKWIREGLSAIRQAPFGMVSVCIFYVFTMTALGSLPLFGLVLAAFFMPFGTMLVIEGTRDAYQGKQPNYSVLIDLFKDSYKRYRLMRVGVLYAVFILVANYIYIFMAMDEVSQWKIIDGRLDWASVQANFPWSAVIVTVVVYALGQMATWFAPALVTWKNMAVGKSIFYSFFGCLRNWLAILVLLIILFGFSILCALAVIILLDTLGLGNLSIFVLMPIAFFLTTMAYSTIWPMWVDIFGDVSAD